MAESLKILGQAALAAATLINIYTVPSGKSATISSIVLCNRTASVVTCRIAIAQAGAVDDLKQYLYYDLELDANSSFVSTIGLTIGATDVIRAYSSAASVSVNIFGVEVS